jgi:hypothetical protein
LTDNPGVSIKHPLLASLASPSSCNLLITASANLVTIGEHLTVLLRTRQPIVIHQRRLQGTGLGPLVGLLPTPPQRPLSRLKAVALKVPVYSTCPPSSPNSPPQAAVNPRRVPRQDFHQARLPRILRAHNQDQGPSLPLPTAWCRSFSSAKCVLA